MKELNNKGGSTFRIILPYFTVGIMTEIQVLIHQGLLQASILGGYDSLSRIFGPTQGLT